MHTNKQSVFKTFTTHCEQVPQQMATTLLRLLRPNNMHSSNTNNPIDFPVAMNEDNNEVMDILQEEAAEVIQAVSKIRRFGLTGKHPDKDYNNQEHLEEELGDMLAMIDILMVNDVVSWGNLHKAKRAKIEKLKKWSNIPNLDKI
jgi:NTP pyrophosphatase (non-canonical NTP hydrolase)